MYLKRAANFLLKPLIGLLLSLAAQPALSARMLSSQQEQGGAMDIFYESAFSDYKPYKDQEIASWPALNAKISNAENARQPMDGMRSNNMNGRDHGSMNMPMDDMQKGNMSVEPDNQKHHH